MFVFADSLSDGGNMFALSGGLAPPVPPYYSDTAVSGGVFSNGPVWVDQFADAHGLTVSNAYAAALAGDNPFASDIVNFAVAGAYSGPQQIDFGAGPADSSNAIDLAIGAPLFPGLQQQVETFTAPFDPSLGIFAPSDALYTVWAGSNDFIFANAFDPVGNVDAADLVDTAVENIRDAIDALETVGAQEFLVFNMPDLGATPDAVRSGNERVEDLSKASDDFNTALEDMLAEAEADLGVAITRLDVNALFADLLSRPDDPVYGLDETDALEDDPVDPIVGPLASCIDDFTTPGVRTNRWCGPGGGNANERIFWDSVHPTEAVHGILAGAVNRAIPEPPMVLLMGISLIAFGAVRRRRTT